MASNPFGATRAQTSTLVRDLAPVTPSDSADIFSDGGVAAGLYVETGGTLVIDTVAGSTRTVAVPDNYTLYCGVARYTEPFTPPTAAFPTA